MIERTHSGQANQCTARRTPTRLATQHHRYLEIRDREIDERLQCRLVVCGQQRQCLLDLGEYRRTQERHLFRHLVLFVSVCVCVKCVVLQHSRSRVSIEQRSSNNNTRRRRRKIRKIPVGHDRAARGSCVALRSFIRFVPAHHAPLTPLTLLSPPSPNDRAIERCASISWGRLHDHPYDQ